MNLLEEALAVASESDLVVLCLGLSPLLEGEEMKVRVEGRTRETVLTPGFP